MLDHATLATRPLCSFACVISYKEGHKILLKMGPTTHVTRALSPYNSLKMQKN